MTTHAEKMQLGGEVLLTTFTGPYELNHLVTCSSRSELTQSVCSCGLDARRTSINLAAANLVIVYGVVPSSVVQTS